MSMGSAAGGTASLTLQLEQAQQLLQQGQIQPAAQLCQNILAKDETCAPAYSIMGDILRRMGNYTSAEKFLDLALRFDEHNPAYRIQKSQTLYNLQRPEDALAEIDAVLAQLPNHAVAHLLRGDYLINLGRYDEALAAFERVRTIENMPGLGEHFGLCYMEMGKLEEAKSYLQDTIHAMPDYFRPYNLMGQICLKMGDEEAAERFFDQALERHPTDYQSWSGKGTVARNRKDDAVALACFQRALQSNPGNYHGYYLMGTFLQHTKRLAEAEPFLRKTIELKPDFLPAQVELGMNLYNTGRKPEALSYIEAALRDDPGNVSLRHMRAGIIGDNPDNAPATYVSDLFDGYADMFEQHLVTGLDYHIPEKARAALTEVMQRSGDSRTDLSLLDLGCGTGLGAVALQTITGWRVGVDLSPKMVEKARQKNLYDALAVADVVEYLASSRRQFDLITAFDVVVYIGNLAPLFAGVASRLAQGGFFSLSIETSEVAESYALLPSGRYGHTISYLQELASAHGLTIVYSHATPIRSENHEPLPGCLFIFQK